MPDRNVRRKVTPRFFFVLATFFIAFYLMYGYTIGYVRMRGIKRQIAEVQQEIAELEKLNSELEQRVALYETDAFIERAAREELGLVHPGEIPVIVIEGSIGDPF